jgi:hypothetical protein
VQRLPCSLSSEISYDSCPLGHAKLNTTALYTRVATTTIRKVMSPLDRHSLIEKKDEPKA